VRLLQEQDAAAIEKDRVEEAERTRLELQKLTTEKTALEAKVRKRDQQAQARRQLRRARALQRGESANVDERGRRVRARLESPVRDQAGPRAEADQPQGTLTPVEIQRLIKEGVGSQLRVRKGKAAAVLPKAKKTAIVQKVTITAPVFDGANIETLITEGQKRQDLRIDAITDLVEKTLSEITKSTVARSAAQLVARSANRRQKQITKGPPTKVETPKRQGVMMCYYCIMVGHRFRQCRLAVFDITQGRCTWGPKGTIICKGERMIHLLPGGIRAKVAKLNGLRTAMLEKWEDVPPLATEAGPAGPM
jgi:hypothetical protein